MTSNNQAKIAFLQMLQQNRPRIFQAIMASMKRRSGMAGLGETVADTVQQPGYFDQFLQTLKELVPTYTAYQMSKDLYDLNLQRAKQGLPPIDAASVSPQLQFGLSPQTQQLLIFGGLGLLGVLMLSRKRR